MATEPPQEPATNPWADLRQLCVDHGCTPVFRAETIGTQVRYSLAAKKRVEVVYDIRLNREWNDAAGAPEAMLDQALAGWWQ